MLVVTKLRNSSSYYLQVKLLHGLDYDLLSSSFNYSDEEKETVPRIVLCIKT